MAAMRQRSGQAEGALTLSAFVATDTFTWNEYRRLALDVQRQASAQLSDETAAAAQLRGQATSLEEMIQSFLTEGAHD